MWYSDIVNRLNTLTDGNGMLTVVALVCGGLLLFIFIIACLCKSGTLYAGVALLLAGAVELAAFVMDVPIKIASFFRAVTWFAIGSLWLLNAMIIALARRVSRRKKRSFSVERKAFDLLPEENNSYVRDRLRTALRMENGGQFLQERKSVPYENRGALRLGYARKLLAKVQDAPLSPAERLETDMLARSFGDYAICETWNAEQLRSVNDLFARLLKLAAKYSVEV